MKYLLKQFVDRDTDWIYKDFSKARKKLIVIYLSIIAVVIFLFSILLIWQLEDDVKNQNITPGTENIIGKNKATEIAKEIYPNLLITETEYELEKGNLYFTVEFEGEKDVKVNVFSGEVKIIEESDESLINILTDDFEEVVIWIGIIVFVISGLGSIFVVNKTLKPIKENTKKQKQFVSDAAHELRNPLAAIHSSLEAELRKKDIRDNNKLLENILSETKKLIKTSEQLLDLEKIESGKNKKEYSNVFEITNLVTKERLKKMLIDKNISVDLTDVNKDKKINLSRKDLEKVLYNLIHNAIKFTDENGNIKISWEDRVLIISDNGIGIKEENLEKIFNRFHKEDSSRSLNKDGNGLGLSLVQEIVHLNGGSISVKSKLEKGTEFKIIL